MLTDMQREPRQVTSNRPLTTLVVVENELVSHGLASMLRAVPAVAMILSCSTMDAALGLIAEHSPDVVLCQGNSPMAPALVQAAAMRDARSLLLLEDLELHTLEESIMVSAHGFLLQSDLTVATLQDALNRLRAGDMPLPPAMARTLMTRLRSNAAPRPAARHVQLTSREQQVLSLLAQGLSNKQIARRLAISEHGVKRHVTNLLAKLNAPNRTLAVALALQDGLLCDSLA